MAGRFDTDGEDYTHALALGSQTALTVSCWFKLSVDTDNYSTIFFVDNGTSDNWGMQTGADGTTMATVFDASTQEGMGSVTVGTWYYVCLATSGTTGTLYYKTANAASLTAQAVTSVTANVNAATLRIGESPWGGEFLNGCVANLRLWMAQLSAVEADWESRQYVPERLGNLQAWYPLVNPETTDYSGNGRTLSGGTGVTREDGPPIPWRARRATIIHTVSSGANVTKEVTDSVGVVDAATDAWALTRAQTDNVSLIDTVTRVATIITTVGDLIGITDALADLITKIITDNVGITDSVGNTWTITRAQVDGVGVLDSAADAWALARAQADVVGVVDAATDTWVVARTVTDALGLLDDASNTVDDTEITRTQTDQITTTDSVATTGTRVHAQTDTVELTDSVGRGLGKTVTDAIGVVDSLAKSFGRTISDTSGIVDQRVATQGHVVVIADVVGLMDGVTTSDTKIALLVDLIGITDDASGSSTGPQTLLRTRVRGSEPRSRAQGSEPQSHLIGTEPMHSVLGKEVGTR